MEFNTKDVGENTGCGNCLGYRKDLDKKKE